MSIFDAATPNPLSEGVAAETPAPVVETPVETPAVVDAPVTAPPVEGAPAALPEPRYLDMDEYGDYLVKVKVDGEEKEVPLKTAREGVMMQQAFTRRTQELAEERNRLYQAEALVAALEQNPEDIIRQLAEANDLDVSGLQRVERSPEEQAFRQQQAALHQARDLAAQAQINAEIAQIRTIDPGFDVAATAAFARENRMPLPTAHMVMRAQQQEQAAAQAAATEQRRQAALAAQVAHQGSAVQSGAVVTPQRPANSVREAFFAAKNAANPN